MKRTKSYFDSFETFEEIDILCGDDEYCFFGSYRKQYLREASYDTYTGSPYDYSEWN